MVFLGGAVLANIVRSVISTRCKAEAADADYRWRIGRICGFQNRNGRNKVLVCLKSLALGNVKDRSEQLLTELLIVSSKSILESARMQLWLKANYGIIFPSPHPYPAQSGYKSKT